jgi:hypothetical protein
LDSEVRRTHHLEPDMLLVPPLPPEDTAIRDINAALIAFYEDTSTDRFFELWYGLLRWFFVFLFISRTYFLLFCYN